MKSSSLFSFSLSFCASSSNLAWLILSLSSAALSKSWSLTALSFSLVSLSKFSSKELSLSDFWKAAILILELASSIRSIALSGRYLSVMYLSDNSTAAFIASSVIFTPWWSSYLSLSPLTISLASSRLGSSTWIGCIRRLRAESFSTCFLYSSIVVAPMICISPLARIGFRIFAASIDPSEAPAPSTMWNSSINSMMSSLFSISSNNFFSLSSKSPLYLLPAIRLARSKLSIVFPFTISGTFPSTILWARPSAMAVFPTPGAPIKIGLFFLLLIRICTNLWISSSLPITGSIFPLLAISFKSLAKLVTFSDKLELAICLLGFFPIKSFRFALIFSLSKPDSKNIRFVKESSSSIIAIKTSSSRGAGSFLFKAIFLASSKICLSFLENSVAGLWELPLPILFITIDLKRS